MNIARTTTFLILTVCLGLTACSDRPPDPSLVEPDLALYGNGHARSNGLLHVARVDAGICSREHASGSVTVSWNVFGRESQHLDIYVRAREASTPVLWTTVSRSGSQKTPGWVTKSTIFELRAGGTPDVIATTGVGCPR